MGDFAPETANSALLEAFQHLPGVPIHLDLQEDLRDLAGFIDQERGSCDAHVLPAVHRFFDPDAVLFADIGILVGEEKVIQPLLLLELSVGADGVLADTEDDRALFGNFSEFVTEPANFKRSAGSQILWVKEEHNLLPGQQFERDDRSIVGRQAERRRL